MKRLLAPNGKPSKLNEEQYKLVRTSAFKKWFGDWENDTKNSSKVIDEETKEPLVVYHGGSVENTFDKDKIGVNDNGWYGYGFYFTEDKSFASEWGELKPYFILINNSFDIVKKGISIINPFYNNSKIETDNKIKEGYNGSIAKLSKPNEYVVYYEFSENIKLADGTNTTFDENNDDIRYAGGGELKAEDMLKKPLTIKMLKDLDDGDGWWAEEYHAKTKNYKPKTYYHLNTKGLNAGVGKGLYLGKDKDALISFYGMELDDIILDTYIGNPNWLDLIDYEDYKTFEKEAIKKYGENYTQKLSSLDIDVRGDFVKKLTIEKGFDGIRYYDPNATGEEFVLFNTEKVKKITNEKLFKKGGEVNIGLLSQIWEWFGIKF